MDTSTYAQLEYKTWNMIYENTTSKMVSVLIIHGT